MTRISFERFMNYVGAWLICMSIICVVIFCIWYPVVEDIENRRQYDHDLLMALQNRSQEVKFFPDTIEAAKILKILKRHYKDVSLKDVMAGLNTVLFFCESQSKNLEPEIVFSKIEKAVKFFSATDKKSILCWLKRLKELDKALAWWDGPRLFEILREKPEKIIMALENKLPDKDLPETYLNSFPLWFLGSIWLLLTFPTFLSYLYYSAHRSIPFYRLPWSKLGTYLIILIWLPGIIASSPVLIVVGIYKGLTIDWIVLWKGWRRREEQLPENPRTEPRTEENGTEIREEQLPEISAAPWYVVEDFQDKKELLLREKITFTEIFIKQPREITGIAFPENERDKAFQVLGITPYNIREIPTDRDNVYLLEYEDSQLFRAQGMKRFQNEKESLKAKYVQECKRRLEKEMAQIRDEVKICSQKLRECSQSIVKESRQIEIKRKGLQSLQDLANSKDYEGGKFGKEFETLCALPHVEWVDVGPGLVKVYTDTIHIDFNSKRYRIGDFEIAIGADGLLEIRNLWDAYGDYDHPHVENKRPCLGNLSEGVAKLVAEYQFAVVTQILIEFLYNVNPGGWYSKIENWKEAD